MSHYPYLTYIDHNSIPSPFEPMEYFLVHKLIESLKREKPSLPYLRREKEL